MWSLLAEENLQKFTHSGKKQKEKEKQRHFFLRLSIYDVYMQCVLLQPVKKIVSLSLDAFQGGRGGGGYTVALFVNSKTACLQVG